MDPEQFDRILLIHALLRALYTWYGKCGVNCGRSVRSALRDRLADLFTWHHQVDWSHPQVAQLEGLSIDELIDLAERHPQPPTEHQQAFPFGDELALIDYDQLICELARHLALQSQVEEWMPGSFDDLLARQIHRLIGGSSSPEVSTGRRDSSLIIRKTSSDCCPTASLVVQPV